ncbi:MAG: hypothetical protein AB7L09_24610 [Nitrospira sp.]
MSFYNNGTNGNYLSHADITDARFRYDQAWTALVFVKLESSTHDDTGLIQKRAGQQQFTWRAANRTEPTRMQVALGSTSYNLNTGYVIYLDTWYLLAISCDGAGTLTAYIFDMEGNAPVDGVTGSATFNAANLTENINIGTTNNGASDGLYGWLSHACYIKQEATRSEVVTYLSTPDSQVSSWGTDVVFYLKMDGEDAADLGTDSSGNDNHFTVSGTPTASGDSPPSIVPAGTAVEATAPGSSAVSASLLRRLTVLAIANGHSASAALNNYWATLAVVASSMGTTAASQNKEQGWTVLGSSESAAYARILAQRTLAGQFDANSANSISIHLDKGMLAGLNGQSDGSVLIKALLSMHGPAIGTDSYWAALLTTRAMNSSIMGVSLTASRANSIYSAQGVSVATSAMQTALRLLLGVAAAAQGDTISTARIVVGELAARVLGEALVSSYLNAVYRMSIVSAGVALPYAVPHINAGLSADNHAETLTLLNLLLQRPLAASEAGTSESLAQGAVEYRLIAALLGEAIASSRLLSRRQLLGYLDGYSAGAIHVDAMRGHIANGAGVGLTAAHTAALRRLLMTATGVGAYSAQSARILSAAAGVAAAPYTAIRVNLLATLLGRGEGIAQIAQLFGARRPLHGDNHGQGIAAADLAALIRLLGAINGISELDALLLAERSVVAMTLGAGAGLAGGAILNPLSAAGTGNLLSAIAGAARRAVAAKGVGDLVVSGPLYADRRLIASNAGQGVIELSLLAERGWHVLVEALTNSSAAPAMALSMSSVADGSNAATLHLVAERMLAASSSSQGDLQSALRLLLTLDADGAGYGLLTGRTNARLRLQSPATGSGSTEARLYELVRMIGTPDNQSNVNLLLNLIMTLGLLADGRTRVDSAVAEIEDANYYTQGRIYG